MSMTGWYLSAQGCKALHIARELGREHGHLNTAHLLAAILALWDDEHAGGPALLRACGISAEQAVEVATALIADYPQPEGPSGQEQATGPEFTQPAQFALEHAFRIAAATHDSYVGTEHLLVAMFWHDNAQELRRLGIDYAQVAKQLTTLPRTERPGPMASIAPEPLSALPVPTTAAVEVAVWARSHAERHPIEVEGEQRLSSLHYLRAVSGSGAAHRFLIEADLNASKIEQRLADPEVPARLIRFDDREPSEMSLDGWEEFEITAEQHEVLRSRALEVIRPLWPQGVRYGIADDLEGALHLVHIHPGRSGVTAQEIFDRLLALTTT